MTEMSTGQSAYDLQYTEYSKAFHAFQKVRREYREGKISDADFVAARKIFDAAQNALDQVEEQMRKEQI